MTVVTWDYSVSIWKTFTGTSGTQQFGGAFVFRESIVRPSLDSNERTGKQCYRSWVAQSLGRDLRFEWFCQRTAFGVQWAELDIRRQKCVLFQWSFTRPRSALCSPFGSCSWLWHWQDWFNFLFIRNIPMGFSIDYVYSLVDGLRLLDHQPYSSKEMYLRAICILL